MDSTVASHSLDRSVERSRITIIRKPVTFVVPLFLPWFGTISHKRSRFHCSHCSNVVQVDADAIARVAEQHAKKEAQPYVTPSAEYDFSTISHSDLCYLFSSVRSGSHNEDKKDSQSKPGRVRVIEDKDPNAPEQSFLVEQKVKSLSDIDANLKCPVDLKVYAFVDCWK